MSKTLSQFPTHTPACGKTPRAATRKGQRLVKRLAVKYYDEERSHVIPSSPWRLGSKPQQGKLHMDVYVIGHLNVGDIFEPWTDLPVEIVHRCNYDLDDECAAGNHRPGEI